MKEILEDFQRDLIRTAVDSQSGNWAAAARQLGVNRSNLHKLAARPGLKK
jgi:anaerobic nitric oxide reductase transcription regulator